VINRIFPVLFLLVFAILLVPAANAQVAVSSHTNIDGQRRIVPICQSVMLDADTIRLYPFAAAQCTVSQNSQPIQTLPICFGVPGSPNAVCTATLGGVVDGADYQTTAQHGLNLQLVQSGCIENGVLVACYSDPLNYVVPEGQIEQIIPIRDSGKISPRGGTPSEITLSTGGSNGIIGTTAETPFQSAQILPSVFHARAGISQSFSLNGIQNADWTFIGSAGTTVPPAPSQAPAQGTSITFQAPNTVPLQQVDTLTACKVDTSHGTDCNTTQIIVDVLHVSIDDSNPFSNPPINPDELLGGKMVHYTATVTQGAQPLITPLKWKIIDDTSGLNLVTIDPDTAFVTVPPQSQFQGANFVVDIQATSPIDPAVAVSAPFTIHIPTVSVQMSQNLGVPPFEAIVGNSFDFSAQVIGPTQPYNQIVSWSQSFFPGGTTFAAPGIFTPVIPAVPNSIKYLITSPIGERVSTTILACVGGSTDLLTGALKEGICDNYVLQLSPPVTPITPIPVLNSGESTAVTIRGTGFGSAPSLSFSDPIVSFAPGTISGPDANGVTTVTGIITVAPVPPTIPASNKTVPATITSSLPPPSTPANQNVVLRPVSTASAITPVNPTLIISQSQQFTPILACQTSGGQTCTVPQTSTCALFIGPGTMSPSCLYTAPASLATQTQVQARACFTFGSVCSPFSINLVPVTVTSAPAAVSLISGQSQQFQATVTNVPNNNQGVTWSINPAVGTITAGGLYAAPAAISAAQSVSITACSVVDATKCSSSTVTLVPPDFGLSATPGTALITPFEEIPVNLTVTSVGGFNGNVVLSATLPAGIGMTSQFSPATIAGSGNSVVTFPISASTPVGSYPVTIVATSGGLVHSVQITVTVAQPTLTLTVGAPQTTSAGQTVTFPFTVNWTGFFGSVSISETGIPPGSTITPTPWDGFEPGSGTLVFTTPANLASGTYNITFTASGAGQVVVGTSSLNVSLTKTASTTLTIPDPPPPPPPPRCTGRSCPVQ
jgi:hypothetical protein